MELIRKGFIYLLCLLAILMVGFIGVNNRITFNSQQQQLEKRLMALSDVIEKKIINEKSLPPIKIEAVDDRNKDQSEKLTQFSQQLQQLQTQLSQLTTQQEQLQKTSSQHEGDIAALIQEMRTAATSENTYVADEILSEQLVQQQQAEEKARMDRMTSNLDYYWQNDTASGGQSAVIETKLRESLAQTEGTDLINVGCKNSVCKLELQQTAEATFAENALFDEALADSTIFTRSFPNTDGSKRIVMYLTQGQTNFPNEIFE